MNFRTSLSNAFDLKITQNHSKLIKFHQLLKTYLNKMIFFFKKTKKKILFISFNKKNFA